MRNTFKDEVREKPAPSLDSKPAALVLPDKSKQPHKAGDTEHFEGRCGHHLDQRALLLDESAGGHRLWRHIQKGVQSAQHGSSSQ